jgi:hypothetical protein
VSPHAHEDKGRARPPAVFQVDAALEELLDQVEAEAGAYATHPGVVERTTLRDLLTTLDEYVARGDAHRDGFFQSPALGFTTRGAVIGATSPEPVVEEVPVRVFQRQAELVVAAKREIQTPTHDTMDALRSTIELLRAAKREEDPVSDPS